MKKTSIFLIVFFFITSKATTYNSIILKGIVLSSIDSSKLSYALIQNKSNFQTYKSNENGNFEINCKIGDTLVFYYLGFEKKIHIVSDSISSIKKIYLRKRTNYIKEITINPKGNNEILNQIILAKDNREKHQFASKMYCELKSELNKNQVELYESYNNVITQGNKVLQTNLKAGRFALKSDVNTNGYYQSIDIANSIKMFDIFEKSDFLPCSPLAIKTGALKRKFYIDYKDEYIKENGDTIVVYSLIKKDSNQNFFDAVLSINTTISKFEKIELFQRNCSIYPFKPINPSDMVKNVEVKLKYDFINTDQDSRIDNINLTYSYIYLSKNSPIEKKLTSNIVYTFYSYNKLFHIPLFDGKPLENLSDIDMITAYPYNDFFWKNHNELNISANRTLNDLYFYSSNAISSLDFQLQSPKVSKIRLNCHNFIHWNSNRIIYNEFIPEKTLILDTSNISKRDFNYVAVSIKPNDKREFGSMYYDRYIVKKLYGTKETPFYFDIKLFLDIDTYHDSTNILTSTVYNPYTSYYYLPVNKYVGAFMNIYFDMFELDRNNLLLVLNSHLSRSEIIQIYKENIRNRNVLENELESLHNKLRVPNNLLLFNKNIKDFINIDNLEIFKISKTEFNPNNH